MGPDLYALKVEELGAEREVARLAGELRDLRRNPSPAQSALDRQLEERLRGQVQIQVALSIKARGEYLLRLKDHMKALEKQLTDQAGNFQATVEKRMQELLDPQQQAARASGPGAAGRLPRSNQD